MPEHHLMIDKTAFESAREMMKNKFEKIIGYYLEDTLTYIEAIKEGLQKKEMEMIIPAAHTIKSSSRQLGAFGLANYAAAIEEQGRKYLQKTGEFSKVEEKCHDLELMFQATELEIKQLIQ